MRQGLGKREAELLRFIAVFHAWKGYAPNFEEMMQAQGLASKSGIHKRLDQLENKGHVTRLHHMSRALAVNEPPASQEYTAGLTEGSRLSIETLQQRGLLDDRSAREAAELLEQVVAESVGFTARQDGANRWWLHRCTDVTTPVSGPHRSRTMAFNNIPNVMARRG